MNKPFVFAKNKGGENAPATKIASRGGSFSLGISAVVLAILVALNIFVSVLPVNLTRFDISSSQLYSITSNTKAVVNALQKDVSIYWITQSGKEDEILKNLLAKYDALSSHLTVSKINPDVYPTFTAKYTDDTVSNNSIIVECGTRSRYLAYDDIYLSDVDYTTYSQVYSFDGEGLITSAIDYVVRDNMPRVYVLEGHGESALPDEFANSIAKANLETASFPLLREKAVPEDAACVLIYAPASDISEEEKTLLSEYVASGGQLLVFAGPTEDGTLTNLYGVLEPYGITAADGVVVEGDQSRYAFQAPYILLPELESCAVTDPLLEENYYVILPIAQGLTVGDTTKGKVTRLMTTSDSAFSKAAGYDLTTYEKEEGDTDGPFALAVSVKDSGGGEILWVASSNALDSSYNAYSSGANLNFAMNALEELVGETDSISIRSKSLGYNYLTISAAQAALMKIIMIGVLPGLFLVTGISTVIERRRMRKHV